jgi:hypothetical protein
MNRGTIPILKELSRSFFQIVDIDRVSLSEVSKINTITATYPNSGNLGVVIIERELEEVVLDETTDEIIPVSLLIPPHMFSNFIVRYV